MTRISCSLGLCFALALGTAGSSTCWAQQSSLFGSSSSGRSTGSTGGGAAGGTALGGSMATAGSTFGAAGGASGGRGATGAQTRSGAGGVQQPQFNTFGSLGNSIGQGDFVGRSDTSGRFVGQTQAGQQNARGTQGRIAGAGGARGGNRNQNQNQNGFGNNFGTGGMANQQAQRKVRPQLKVAFPTVAVPATTVTSNLQQRFTNNLTLTAGSLKGVQLSMDDVGTVTLRGSVENADAKSLAAAMVRLEPGVRKVVNELEVGR